MKIVSIKNELLDEYRKIDKEMLDKHGRPCLLVVRLKYKDKNRMFAIPFRSNIPGNVPKSQYFSLPPRPSTKQGHRHGIHYIKMFPVAKCYLERYRLDNPAAKLYDSILNRNQKKIIEECQGYLERYENGDYTQYSTSIDILIKKLEQLMINN
ncbi:MAG: hypothetical protein J6N55_05615 [Anaerovibrio sp.]|uniref:hypothetical protein n=1 Tax=Anaerovibrio sp. TaxID=1872532 RepID=UPI001B17E692|nr:hypothetical protein [Anaerovibrio sp.]MBO6245743.1 hypothetical protein [Anaerovibrio sp.]